MQTAAVGWTGELRIILMKNALKKELVRTRMYLGISMTSTLKREKKDKFRSIEFAKSPSAPARLSPPSSHHRGCQMSDHQASNQPTCCGCEVSLGRRTCYAVPRNLRLLLCNMLFLINNDDVWACNKVRA